MENKGPNILEIMVADKIKDIRGAISEIESEMRERKGIDKKVLSEIEKDIGDVRNRILEIEQFCAPVQGGQPFPKIDTLEREVISLEGQKRFEEVSCWRDLTQLRKELRIYLRELSDIMRRMKLVKNDSS